MLTRLQHAVVACLIAALVSTTAAFAPSARAAGAIPIRYTYDANGRLSSVIDPAAGSAAYSYDATGNITAITRRAITTLAVLEVAPDGGPVGTNVSIDGTGFSATPSLNTVKFNGTTAVVVSASTTELVATVPAGATTGTITVKVGNTTATSPTTFKVGSTVPTVTSFSPSIALPGTAIAVNGTNFETVSRVKKPGQFGLR
jgi:YD repeat-containing protein